MRCDNCEALQNRLDELTKMINIFKENEARVREHYLDENQKLRVELFKVWWPDVAKAITVEELNLRAAVEVKV